MARVSDRNGVGGGPGEAPLAGEGRRLDPPWRAPAPPDTWPVPEGDDVVFFSEVTGPTERRLLDGWVAGHRPPGTAASQVTVVHFDRMGSGGDIAEQEGRIAELTRGPADPWFTPIRVVWQPPRVRDDRTVRLTDVLLVGDPRRPRRKVQPLLARVPGSTTVVNGGAAHRSWLERRWRRQTDAGSNGTSFPHFLLLQGVLAMERAEASLIGAQYKVPRLVREDLASGTRFQAGLADLAASLQRPLPEVRAEADRYLDEMVTGYGRLLIDLFARFGRFVYRQGYDAHLDYDDAQVETVRRTLGTHPAVVLPTHKSMIDTMVMPAAFAELGLPRSHTLGGINLAFWPVGQLMRRSGVIFIRRKITDNPVYRYTLREYVGYLVEKRFNLEWYIEGGRTRTGKLLPPRLGLLSYVADAYWQGRAEDVMLLPVAIAYDQLHEVNAFSEEARGGKKEKENLSWLIHYLRAQRANFGRVYVRFGEPVSMRAMLGPPPAVSGGAGRPDQLALQKMAFEVAVRINRVTPITASALVAFVLTGARGQALTLDQVSATLADPLAFIATRALPMTESARRLSSPAGVRSALDELRRHAVVTAYEDGEEPVFVIGPGAEHAAAFYRNSILHFFLVSAIGELALLRAAAETDDPRGTFWSEVGQLRDLLKFDFFFPDKGEFREVVAAEMGRQEPDWEAQVGAGGVAARTALGAFRPLCSHLVLRAFLEAYWVVAEVIAEWPGAPVNGVDAAGGEAAGVPVLDEAAVVARALQVGHQYYLQGKLHRPEAVSQLLFRTGVAVAANRHLLGDGEPPDGGLAAGRAALVDELKDLLRAVDVVEALAAAELHRQVGAVPFPAILDAYAADMRQARRPAPEVPDTLEADPPAPAPEAQFRRRRPVPPSPPR